MTESLGSIIMEDNRNLEIKTFENEFWETIGDCIGVRIGEMVTSGNTKVNDPLYFQARFPTLNHNLKDTPYLYLDSKKLLHFTSVNALFSILNECSVRLYNLHNSNDKNEYNYAARELKHINRLNENIDNENSVIINNIKANSYVLSCTSIANLYKSKFWKNYGDKGKGVAIEFEIMNDLFDWRYF